MTVALLARVWMSARSSSMLRFVLKVSVVDEQLIQPAARDLYAPVCWNSMFISPNLGKKRKRY